MSAILASRQSEILASRKTTPGRGSGLALG
jgi:hypothetical protein